MKFYRITLLLILAIQHFSFSQAPFCGFDELREKLITNHPAGLYHEQQMHESVYRAIINNEVSRGSGGVIIIPLVFHIMHNNGPENVADSVIVNAVNELNLRFQNAAPYDDSTGNAINIQFCLASVDPQGNITTGITRTVTSLTNLSMAPGDDEAMKSLNRWSSLLYCNVYIVNQIAGGVAGYATYPYWAGSGIDGIVMEAAYLTNYHVLAHEIGHYCGLAHTFSYSCSNQNCLLEGDQVCDTPPDTSSLGFPCLGNSCTTDAQDTTGLSPFTTDVNELPNYMDYTSCPLSFTQGQGERMETMVTLNRSLLSSSNGCGGNPGQAAPVAGFDFSVSTCNDGMVAFSDSTAVNTLTSEWDFDNDGIYEFIGHDFNYTFPSSGTYPVKQRVTGIGGQDSISHSVTVMKGSTFNYPIIYPGAAMDTIQVCGGDTITFSGDPSGTSYLWSTGATTSSILFPANASIGISLTMTDANGFIWSSQCTPIYVEVYPYNVPVITYDDTVGYRCAGDLLSLYIANPIAGVYTWHVYHISTGWFNTQDHHLFYDYYVDPVNGSQFYVTYTNAAGCTEQSNIISVQPHQLPFMNNVPLFVTGLTLSYNTSNFQYQWYNYNIPIPGAITSQYTVTSGGCYRLKAWDAQYPDCESYTDTVCFTFTGIDEPENVFSIHPNPASGLITVTGLNNGKGKCEYKVWNVLGDEIIAAGVADINPAFNIDCSAWRNGIYILEINKENNKFRKKIIVARE